MCQVYSLGSCQRLGTVQHPEPEPEHGKTRPNPGDARKMFEKYLGKLNTAIIDTSISFAVNFDYQIYALAQSETINPPSFGTPNFDSELGIEIDTSTVTVIPEIPEHSFYLMQRVRIGGTNHLIFFDRGANTHLVQGKMAVVAAGFEITLSCPTSLTVVGGGGVCNLNTGVISLTLALEPRGSTMRSLALAWIQ